jgi:hypothetical protein
MTASAFTTLNFAVNTSCLEETRPRRMVDDFERWFVDV